MDEIKAATRDNGPMSAPRIAAVLYEAELKRGACQINTPTTAPSAKLQARAGAYVTRDMRRRQKKRMRPVKNMAVKPNHTAVATIDVLVRFDRCIAAV